MDKIIQNIINYRKRIDKPIKESSLKTYETSLKRIIKLVEGKNYVIKSREIFLDYKNIIQVMLNNKMSVSVRKKIINAILVALTDDKKYREVKTKYNNYRLKIEEEINKKYKIQTKTVKENDNWVSLKNLCRVVKNVKVDFDLFTNKFSGTFTNNDKQILNDYIITQLYLGDIKNHPPRRNVYCTFNIVSDDINKKKYKNNKKQNLLVVVNKSTKYFKFVNYKTNKDKKSNNIKELIINLSPKMNRTINKILPYLFKYYKLKLGDKWYKKSYEIPLITNFNTNKPMKENNLTTVLNRIFKSTKCKIGTSMLRKIVASEFYKNSKSHKEKAEFSKLMGHNPYTNEHTYNKKE